MFQELISLQVLRMAINKITSIEAQTFLNLRNLRILQIHINKITTIEEQAFADLSNLKTLYLYNNQLSTLSYDMFTGFSSLNILNLERNKLKTLEASVLKNFDRPLQLWLLDNSLECDNKLCWLKIELERGTILWHSDSSSGGILKPPCVGGKIWDEIKWNCRESKFISKLKF